MSIIILERNSNMIVTNEQELYAQYGKPTDDEEYDLNESIWNGEIYYSEEDGCFKFEYTDWKTMQAYHHIEWCVELLNNKDKDFDKYIMFHVLTALEACGAIEHSEYEALHNKYCKYN